MKLSYTAIYITVVISFTIIVVNCVGTENEQEQNGMGGGIWMCVFGILLLIVIVFLIVWMVKQIRK